MLDFRKELYSVTPYTPGEQPPVRSRIIKLNTNENPYAPSPQAMNAGKKVLEDGILRKYPQPGSDRLVESIAKSHGVSTENIIVTNGSDEAIRLLFTGILETEDTLAYPDPTYSAYPVFAETILEKIHLEKIPLEPDLRFPWTKMEKSPAKLMCFANPNAPTGILEEKALVRNFLDTFSGFTLCDEAYIDFAPDNSSMISSIKDYPRLFVSRTFSKSYSLAGLRLGYLVGNSNFINLLHKIRDSYNIGLLDQEIGKAAVEDVEYFQKTKTMVVATRERVKQSLRNLGFMIPDSSTNFLFCKPPQGYEAKDIFERLKEKEIYVRYFSQGISSRYIRVSIGTDEEMTIFLEEIKSILD